MQPYIVSAIVVAYNQSPEVWQSQIWITLLLKKTWNFTSPSSLQLYEVKSAEFLPMKDHKY